MKRVLYLYGITRAPEKPVTIRGPGVDGSSAVESVNVEGLAAWYSAVSAVEFAEELAQRMENLEWLADSSVRHQRVVGQIYEETAIVPARFGTVFVSLDNLKKDAASRARETRDILERVADAEEWGVKVIRKRPVASPGAVSASSGAEYLRKKAALQQRRETAVSSDIIEFANELSQLSAAAAAVGKVSAAQRDLEWQAAFLIKKSEKARWDAVLRQYATKWSESREIQCTGPWPPYSFV